MNLQGFYTNKGLALAAKIAGGITPLTVTRIDAGSGHTTDIPAADALQHTEQTLTVGTPEASGSTATLPATLAEVLAGQDYTLTELGVYADDPDEGEILFQIYQLTDAAAITAGGEGVLRFYLRQSVGTQGVTVTCSGAGLAIDSEFRPVQARVQQHTLPSRTVSVTAAGLQAYLDALPRLLGENLTISVSTPGTITGGIHVHDFFGGSLAIVDSAGVTLQGKSTVENCDAFILLQSLSFEGDEDNNYSLSIQKTDICIQNCTFTGADANSAIGFSANTTGYLVNSKISHYRTTVFIGTASYLSVSNTTAADFHDNYYGIGIWRGGIAVLNESTPDTLGGLTNNKSGGALI